MFIETYVYSHGTRFRVRHTVVERVRLPYDQATDNWKWRASLASHETIDWAKRREHFVVSGPDGKFLFANIKGKQFRKWLHYYGLKYLRNHTAA